MLNIGLRCTLPHKQVSEAISTNAKKKDALLRPSMLYDKLTICQENPWHKSETTGKHKGMCEYTNVHTNNEMLCTGIKNENILLWNNLKNVFGARNWRISTQHFV